MLSFGRKCSIKKLYTFIEESTQPHHLFQNLEKEKDHVNVALKNLSATASVRVVGKR